MKFEELPRVQGVIVDVDALGGIAYECDPALCRDTQKCCASYDVCLDEDELPMILGGMHLAMGRAPHLEDKPAPFEHVMGRLYALDTDEDGLCTFAWRNGNGHVLCALHSAALERGLDLHAVKPRCCLMWPLAMTDSEPHYLSVDPGAFEFPCCTRREPDGALHESIRRHVEFMFGRAFLDELEAAMAALPAPE